METIIAQSERRKQVRLRRRLDLEATAQRYEGRAYHVIKDPINLKYYRFNDQEYFVFKALDGQQTLDQVQKSFENTFRPERLSLEDLEVFVRQLVQSGLVHHESPNPGRQLFDKRRKERRLKRFAAISNILYIKLPLIDPDRLLNWMFSKTKWIFTNLFLFLSVMFMLAAVGLVLFKFQVFWDKLPAYQEFFRFRTLLHLWISLGVVKVIHEFGHGLSCKAFGGECHQMGFLFMCFSPSLYCNVSDSWTLANKWQRMLISFAGIYVELMIAALSTFVWWYTPHWPFINNIALCLMTLCSVSTFMFNANPLMRFDGYYILADWLEVPNLREKANRFVGRVVSATCLGVEPPEQPYMALWRKWLFAIYAVASWIYRWVITFSILYFLSNWLKPYKMETLSYLLAAGALASMIGWPIYRLVKNIMQRGRLPDMKSNRVRITIVVAGLIVIAFFFLPLPLNRVRETGLVQIQDGFVSLVMVPDPGGELHELYVHVGDAVQPGQPLASFRNQDQAVKTEQAEQSVEFYRDQCRLLEAELKTLPKQAPSRADFDAKLAKNRTNLRNAEMNSERERQVSDDLKTVKADRAGTVINSPRQADMNKFWDKAESEPFCKIGDRTKMRITVPVTTLEYREIKEGLDLLREQKLPADKIFLPASILFTHRSDHICPGRVTSVPDRHEENIPLGLTSRGGGPVAVKPAQNQSVNEPVAQTYLIQVEIVDPDGSIIPGEQARVKIHLQWRSAAWWVGQKLASALDWGLW